MKDKLSTPPVVPLKILKSESQRIKLFSIDQLVSQNKAEKYVRYKKICNTQLGESPKVSYPIENYKD